MRTIEEELDKQNTLERPTAQWPYWLYSLPPLQSHSMKLIDIIPKFTYMSVCSIWYSQVSLTLERSSKIEWRLSEHHTSLERHLNVSEFLDFRNIFFL